MGLSLLACSFALSFGYGHNGRIGLHVADEWALKFYNYVSEKYCASGLFHPEKRGITAPRPRGIAESGKTYLESVEDAATRWLDYYRRTR